MTTSMPPSAAWCPSSSIRYVLPDPGGGAEQDPVLAAMAGCYAPSTLWTMRSISLIPRTGAMIPPSP